MPITKASGQAVAVAAKGDLVVGSATNDAAVLSVGSANQVLTVDSSTTTGLKWATASSGSLTSLSDASPTTSTYSVTGLSSSYKNLVILFKGVGTNSGLGQNCTFYFNNDTGTNYMYNILTTSGGTAATQTSNTDQQIPLANLLSNTGGNSRLNGQIIIYDYFDTSNVKTGSINVRFRNQGSTEQSKTGVFVWNNTTNAINSIYFSVASGSSWSGGQIVIYGAN